jgi:CarD family transcriptional regulator
MAKKTAKTTKKPAKAMKKQAKKAVKAKASKKPAAKKVAPKKAMKKPAAKKLAVKKPAAIKQAVKKAPVKIVTRKDAPVAAPVAQKMQAKQPQSKQPQRYEAQKSAPVAAKDMKALFKVGNYVVYPTHGVGRIMAEESQIIGDIELRLLVINFERDKMTLRVPMNRAAAAGLRPISGTDKMKEVYVTLKNKAKISRGMWSRRAQEYEAKINSGNIILIAEVVRDLHQNVDQSERSYSERMIYENALNRLVGEVAAAEHSDTKAAHDKLMKLLRAKVAAAAALKEAA